MREDLRDAVEHPVGRHPLGQDAALGQPIRHQAVELDGVEAAGVPALRTKGVHGDHVVTVRFDQEELAAVSHVGNQARVREETLQLRGVVPGQAGQQRILTAAQFHGVHSGQAWLAGHAVGGGADPQTNGQRALGGGVDQGRHQPDEDVEVIEGVGVLRGSVDVQHVVAGVVRLEGHGTASPFLQPQPVGINAVQLRPQLLVGRHRHQQPHAEEGHRAHSCRWPELAEGGLQAVLVGPSQGGEGHARAEQAGQQPQRSRRAQPVDQHETGEQGPHHVAEDIGEQQRPRASAQLLEAVTDGGLDAGIGRPRAQHRHGHQQERGTQVGEDECGETPG